MTKIEEFINYFNYLVAHCDEPTEPSQEIKDFLKSLTPTVKPAITESGIPILEYFQSLDNPTGVKTKDIVAGILMPSRTVSGAIRKLVADGYIDKKDTSPVSYDLTEKGAQFDIMKYKESLQDE